MVAAATTTHKSLAEALVAAQAKMPPVKPDATNPHFKSEFVSLDHLIAETRGVLNAHGLAIVQFPSQIAGAPALETVIVHVSGEQMSSVMPLLVGKNDMQGLGGALTYARRYAWAAALGISSETDDDGNSSSVQATPATAEKPAFVAPAPKRPTVQALEAFAAKAAEYKKAAPDFDVDGALQSCEGKDAGWLKRATERLEQNMDAAKVAA